MRRATNEKNLISLFISWRVLNAITAEWWMWTRARVLIPVSFVFFPSTQSNSIWAYFHSFWHVVRRQRRNIFKYRLKCVRRHCHCSTGSAQNEHKQIDRDIARRKNKVWNRQCVATTMYSTCSAVCDVLCVCTQYAGRWSIVHMIIIAIFAAANYLSFRLFFLRFI